MKKSATTGLYTLHEMKLHLNPAPEVFFGVKEIGILGVGNYCEFIL